jgi:hypothetical protein
MICTSDDPRADFPLDMPVFSSSEGNLRFTNLSDAQIAEYRGAWRRALERSVADFNPDLIHCLHLWLPAHAALETGVPYVATVAATELDASRDDPRYRRFLEQAAQNAGKLLAVDDATRQRLLSQMPELAGRIVSMPFVAGTDNDAGRSQVQRTAEIYSQVLSERRGVIQ